MSRCARFDAYKYSIEVKLRAVKEYKDGIKSSVQLGNELNCNPKTIRDWVSYYEVLGEYGFEEKN